MKKCQVLCFCLLILMFVAEFLPFCFGVDADESATAISQADLSLNSAYVAVAKAQGAGADVERLIEDLEVAGDFLSEAHLAFRSGDYEAANLLAMECRNAVEGLVAEAARLEASAEITKTDTLLYTAFWSGFGLTLLLVLGVVGWIMLKKRFFERVLEMRPEVEEAR